MFQAETYNIPSNLEEIRDWSRLEAKSGTNSHTSIRGLADDKMDKSGWMDWNRIWASYRELSGKTKYYHPRIHRR